MIVAVGAYSNPFAYFLCLTVHFFETCWHKNEFERKERKVKRIWIVVFADTVIGDNKRYEGTYVLKLQGILNLEAIGVFNHLRHKCENSNYVRCENCKYHIHLSCLSE
jgi:hypothetical protein